ncbi:hypothetical protein ID858_13815 [Xenorhabdus sp. DI]|uniref:hypothetical protein n=1 Tax=Xenorhabdus doucetiae TaxID=351671 RepID=UPI0019846E33|nr:MULTISPECIES: hypothetical protein [unclassified Xenorhabdus]MBD2785930.1 hypothetical protein [Xenorhabdus sp. 3]MBD2789587.1 hypothetical protein [Xenorhabdus sp. DI]MBD2794945.1 hypothetical protein [Xenorhabdus sp. 18]
MKRKLAACILSLMIGTIVTANANALACDIFSDSIKKHCENLCNNVPDKILRELCL